MDDNNRATLKQKIKDEIALTSDKIKELESMTEPIAPENSIGRISRMDAINNKSVMEAALRTASKKLSNLQLALVKVASPDFGNCSECGKQIQEKRLMLMPESKQCIRCAR